MGRYADPEVSHDISMSSAWLSIKKNRMTAIERQRAGGHKNICRSTRLSKGGYMLRPGLAGMLWVKPWVVITPENVLVDTCGNKSLKETVVSVMSLPPEE